MRLMNEILGQLYQDRRLYQCFYDGLQIHPDRMRKVHYIVMNYDRMSSQEIREAAFGYGEMIGDEDLFARQMFLCLLRLANEVDG